MLGEGEGALPLREVSRGGGGVVEELKKPIFEVFSVVSLLRFRQWSI